MSDPFLGERFRLWLRELDAPVLSRLATDYAQAAFDGGLRVLRADGSWWAIPPALTPVVESQDDLTARSQLAHHLLSGLSKIATSVLGGNHRERAELLLAGLSPAERRLVDATWRAGAQVAIARADLFTDGNGSDRPLEMNTTIPAMQGYADICAQAFVLAVARQAGLSRAAGLAIWRKNGSNVDDLLQSLLAHLERLGRPGGRPTIAIVARPQDSQSAELTYLAQQFNAAGVVAHRCTPEQLSADDRGEPQLLSAPVDLIYRHVFVRNVAEDLPFARMLRDPVRARILNPPNSQLEVKALFAELSEAAADPARAAAYGLDGGEVTAALRIPWNRTLHGGPSTGFDREPLADLVAFAAAHPEELVLKRSWSYGGTSVLLGDEIDTPAGQARAHALIAEPGTAPLPWARLIERCAAGGGFVVQQKVQLATQRHLVASAEGARAADWYVDISAFTNLGVDVRPSGGVRRGSVSRIVNIVGGGGLVPALRSVVMADLLQALGA